MKQNPNIRILFNNVADEGELVASSEAGTLVAANLRSNLKSNVWRGLGTSEALACVWDDPRPVGVVVLAFNNFTASATVRVRGFTRDDDLAAHFDTGDVQCAPPGKLGQFPWGMPLGENFYARGGASLFAYGYGGYGVVWMPDAKAVRKLEIFINDPDNPDGYVEAGRLIVGPWWSPKYNFDFNHSISFQDATQNKRTEAGDLRGEEGAKWRRVEFAVSNMDAEDRAGLLQIIRRHGLSKPVFVSLFPENGDTLLEQSYQLWGKFAETSKLSQPNYDVYAAPLAIEEM